MQVYRSIHHLQKYFNCFRSHHLPQLTHLTTCDDRYHRVQCSSTQTDVHKHLHTFTMTHITANINSSPLAQFATINTFSLSTATFGTGKTYGTLTLSTDATDASWRVPRVQMPQTVSTFTWTSTCPESAIDLSTLSALDSWFLLPLSPLAHSLHPPHHSPNAHAAMNQRSQSHGQPQASLTWKLLKYFMVSSNFFPINFQESPWCTCP